MRYVKSTANDKGRIYKGFSDIYIIKKISPFAFHVGAVFVL